MTDIIQAIGDAPSFLGVTGVTSVQASNHAGLAVTHDETTRVTGVTAQPESVESAIALTVESPIPTTAAHCPCYRVVERYTKLDGGTSLRSGVWHFAADREGNVIPTWICSPIYVDAITHDSEGNNFGRQVRFQNSLGKWREWAMAMELLKGSGDDLRGELLSMGMEIDPSPKARAMLANYLQSQHPKRRMRCATQTGWCGKSFVLPGQVYGEDSAEVIFQSGERHDDEYTVGGTLEGWQSEVSARAVGNPLLIVALSAAFSGALLALTNSEGGGIHFVGDSSTGKTTLLEAGGSTWGGRNYKRSWRATSNGLEGVACKFNDGLLVLDEISECESRDVQGIVYALGNGVGKQRASRTGSARSVKRWRSVVLSSGERTVETAMAEGGFRSKAGMSVRLIDIPAQRRYGAWDDLHGLASGAAFSDAIKTASQTHYGHAGRAFLEKLTCHKADFSALLEEFKSLPAFNDKAAEGQSRRVSARLALIAMAGELATDFGVTGWNEGEAIAACSAVLSIWLESRGKSNDEQRQVFEALSGFIDRHGDSRFSGIEEGSAPHVRDRAGWWEITPDGKLFLFTNVGLKEALRGFDFKRTLDVLVQRGVLPSPSADGKRASLVRIGGVPKRLYRVNPAALVDSNVS